jgi:hypothetical protein
LWNGSPSQHYGGTSRAPETDVSRRYLTEY